MNSHQKDTRLETESNTDDTPKPKKIIARPAAASSPIVTKFFIIARKRHPPFVLLPDDVLTPLANQEMRTLKGEGGELLFDC